RVVPARGLHVAAEDGAATHVVLVGDRGDVALDLGLGGERARPTGVEGERVRVEVRRYVARGAGVGVVAPGAADLGGSFQDEKVLSRSGQLDGCAESGEPAADDEGVDPSHVRADSIVCYRKTHVSEL